jgi:hypothetical protein
MRTFIWTPALLCSALACGCSFNARDADTYRKVTRQLLETKNADIKGCYDIELAKDANVAGTVVVKFTVQRKSGKITSPTLDAASTAPAGLGQCVVNARPAGRTRRRRDLPLGVPKRLVFRG